MVIPGRGQPVFFRLHLGRHSLFPTSPPSPEKRNVVSLFTFVRCVTLSWNSRVPDRVFQSHDGAQIIFVCSIIRSAPQSTPVDTDHRTVGALHRVQEGLHAARLVARSTSAGHSAPLRAREPQTSVVRRQVYHHGQVRFYPSRARWVTNEKKSGGRHIDRSAVIGARSWCA